MKFENIRVFNFEWAFRGMRNPFNSWNKSDSAFGLDNAEGFSEKAYDLATKWTTIHPLDADYDKEVGKKLNYILANAIVRNDQYGELVEYAAIGPNDMALAKKLIAAGGEHRKFLRQIVVSVDITAPRYFWTEFDTYKVGTVANSTSTMHTLTHKAITLDSFEISDFNNIQFPIEAQKDGLKYNIDEDFVQMCLIPYLEHLRQRYCELKDNEPIEAKKIWKELIRWLPNGFLQTRTVTMNYENLYNMYHQRKNHKLTEWSKDFINFVSELPYAQELLM